jgi:hypothetical protein
MKSLETRFYEKTIPEPNSGCLLWTACLMHFGYGGFAIPAVDGTYTARAHRVAWEMVNGPIPDGVNVLHKCDVPACVNVDHLFLGTQKDNVDDMIEKGRGIHGEDHWSTRLQDSQVKEIRSRWPAESLSALGREYGVSTTTIWRIAHRKNWRRA